jgi:hypothetical protein
MKQFSHDVICSTPTTSTLFCACTVGKGILSFFCLVPRVILASPASYLICAGSSTF